MEYELETYELVQVKGGKRRKICELQETDPNNWRFATKSLLDNPVFDLTDSEASQMMRDHLDEYLSFTRG